MFVFYIISRLSKMFGASVLIFFVFLQCINVGLLQGTGSGANGKLRLCVVETKGAFKRSQRYCPVLDSENADVECVIGTDRLDCLRRISKGTVDFGVFSPEDLVAAQWASLDVLVTNEIRHRDSKEYERSVVAIVNRRVLPDYSSTLHAVLRNRTLCHPGVGLDNLRPLSDTLAGYLESLVLERSCDPALSLTENRVHALSRFFGKACRAGAWTADAERDAELKQKYPSLCAACGDPSRCTARDRYWGAIGALQCAADGAGDVAWAEYDDVSQYFGLHRLARDSDVYPPYSALAYLCRDGTWRPIGGEPCIWLHRPWNVIVAKRKAAAAVAALTATLTNDSVVVDTHWAGALTQLLDTSTALRDALSPPIQPVDYLSRAKGFREAYSQGGCDPPRYITVCTTSLLEKHKCEWLGEAGAVYGVTPPLQCAYKEGTEQCMRAVAEGDADIAVGDSDWLVKGARDYSIAPILHEMTPIVEKTNTIVAYVRKDSKITKMADLRGKKAAFPRYDGVAWHSVLSYFTEKHKITCEEYTSEYFKEVCAPGAEGKINNAKNCYEDGETEALNSLLEGRTDVAFVDMATYKMLADNQTANVTLHEIMAVCPEENLKYCYVSWSAIGHVFAAKNVTAMRRQEIINVLGNLDELFGRNYPFRKPMFSMYGAFNHKLDLLFHSNTKNLSHDNVFRFPPYNSMPLNYEQKFLNKTNYTCSFGGKSVPSFIILTIGLLTLIISF